MNARGAPPGAVEGVEGGRVAAADGVDRVDGRVPVEDVAHRGEQRGVEPVGVGDLADRALRRQGAHRRAEAHLAFLLAAEHAPADGDQDAARVVRGDRGQQVRGGAAGGAVVHADVGRPARWSAGRSRAVTVGMPRSARRATASTTAGSSGALSSTPARPASPERVQHPHDVGDRAGFAQVEPRADDGRPQGRQLGLQRLPDGAGEPLGREHDEVDEEGAGAEPQLGALPAEVGDGAADLGHGARPHPGPFVQDAVDGGRAEPGLLGDLADAVRRSGAARR